MSANPKFEPSVHLGGSGVLRVISMARTGRKVRRGANGVLLLVALILRLRATPRPAELHARRQFPLHLPDRSSIRNLDLPFDKHGSPKERPSTG